ncbi:hypothetical protein ACP4OV_003280 [Aristida adscensionis]
MIKLTDTPTNLKKIRTYTGAKQISRVYMSGAVIS